LPGLLRSPFRDADVCTWRGGREGHGLAAKIAPKGEGRGHLVRRFIYKAHEFS